jgi:excisionase family DNA binding protein
MQNIKRNKDNRTIQSAIKQKDVLTIKEASRLMNVTTNTLREWIGEGIFQTLKIGRREVLLKANISEFYSL